MIPKKDSIHGERSLPVFYEGKRGGQQPPHQIYCSQTKKRVDKARMRGSNIRVQEEAARFSLAAGIYAGAVVRQSIRLYAARYAARFLFDKNIKRWWIS